MKYLFCLAVLLLTSIVLPAQQQSSIEPGTAFDYSANTELNAVLSKERQTGRKVIIDLFTSNCVVCFRMMPKMEELQEKYKSSLRVILVGKHDRDIRKLYDRFQKLFSLTLPVLYDSSLFKHYLIPSVPRYIWLNEQGIVQAVTGPDELAPNYIDRFLAGLPVNSGGSPSKKTFNSSQLLLVNGNGGADTSFLFRSLLSRWNPTQTNIYPSRLTYSAHGKFFQALGISVADLYRYAYFGWARWTTKDPVYGHLYPVPIFIGTDSMQADRGKYNYSFMKTGGESDSLILQCALRNDLATYFGYEALVTEKMMPCWKLIALPGASEQLKSKYRASKMAGSYTQVDYQHVPVAIILELLLFSQQDDFPFIDATGIDFPIDVSIEAVLYDRISTVEALHKIGLDLVRSECSMKVLMLKKN